MGLFVDELNEDNFLLFAMKMYDNPQFTGVEEFYEDLHRIKYIKRLLRRYEKTGELRERLILNHIIILANVFSPSFCSKMLFYKLEEDLYPSLKTFLIYLEYLPDDVGDIDLDLIPLEDEIVERLREI